MEVRERKAINLKDMGRFVEAGRPEPKTGRNLLRGYQAVLKAGAAKASGSRVGVSELEARVQEELLALPLEMRQSPRTIQNMGAGGNYDAA